MVAGAGYDPATFGLWGRRATNCFHPAKYKKRPDVVRIVERRVGFIYGRAQPARHGPCRGSGEEKDREMKTGIFNYIPYY